MKRSLALAAALAAMMVVACDGGSGASEAPPGPIAFANDEAADGATIFLRTEHADAERVSLEVVARGIKDVHGTALRLTWDPAALELVDVAASSAWSKQVVAAAKEGTPGQLAIGWTEKGEGAGVDAMEEIVLGTISFASKRREGSAVTFRTDRSVVVDAKGTRQRVSFRGGRVSSR